MDRIEDLPNQIDILENSTVKKCTDKKCFHVDKHTIIETYSFICFFNGF